MVSLRWWNFQAWRALVATSCIVVCTCLWEACLLVSAVAHHIEMSVLHTLCSTIHQSYGQMIYKHYLCVCVCVCVSVQYQCWQLKSQFKKKTIFKIPISPLFPHHLCWLYFFRFVFLFHVRSLPTIWPMRKRSSSEHNLQ